MDRKEVVNFSKMKIFYIINHENAWCRMARNLILFLCVAFLLMITSTSNASDEVEWECLATEFPIYLEAKADYESNRILLKARSGEYVIPPQWKATITPDFNSINVGTIYTTNLQNSNSTAVKIKNIELTEKITTISWNLLEIDQVCDWLDGKPKGSLSNKTKDGTTICGIGYFILPVLTEKQKIILNMIDGESWTPVAKFKVMVEPLDDTWEDADEESSDVNCE